LYIAQRFGCYQQELNVANYHRNATKQVKLNTREVLLIWRRLLTATVRSWIGYFSFALLAFCLSGCRKADAALSERPRDQVFPAFIPKQLPPFECPALLTPPDLSKIEAEALFDESNSLLKSQGQFYADPKAVELLKQKADARQYWTEIKMNLQLIEGERKVVLVEKAISAGEPEAFLLMGELYMEGDGVKISQPKALAFWQRAATLGSVQAMVKLAVLLSTKQANTIGWDLANIPVATSMLECAMKKGHGDAAVQLHTIVSQPRTPDGSLMEDPDNAAQARGLVVLQEGVKLGSREAASELASYFRTMHGFAAYNAPDPHSYASEDALRARYYQFFQHNLNETTPERLPNLDAAVPLPPAPLPDWRDKEDTIVGLWEAAIAPPSKAIMTAAKSVK
jgi:TPR repeat protein